MFLHCGFVATVTDWMAEVYAAINTLQERVLTAQNNVKRGLANIAAWGDIPLHNRKDNPDKLELLAVHERNPRFIARCCCRVFISQLAHHYMPTCISIAHRRI